MREKMIADTTVLLISLITLHDAFWMEADATFRPSQPIPFHLSPIFSKGNEARNNERQIFPPSQQQQDHHLRREIPLPSGFIPIQTFATPPSQFAPLPWQGSRPSPLVSKTTEHNSTPLLDPEGDNIPSITKSKKGSMTYPKKWIPEPLDGKKIKQKDVEKRRKQILVATSMTKKDISDQEEEKNGEKKQRHTEPKYLKMPVRYESQATTDKHSVQPFAEKIPIEAVEHGAFSDIHQVPKPYAHNHRQETSSSGFTPLFAAEPSESVHSGSGGFVGQESIHGIGDGSGDRVTFHIHGEKGPKSYRFGYDTGKGHDRHFRYEERDDHGNVKGHFGFYDKHGKLQVVHYSADPKNGFSADGGNFGKHAVL